MKSIKSWPESPVVVQKIVVRMNYGILFWFFSMTRLKKKSWPLILSFSPSCRSRKNWEKHYFEAEATPKPQKMFFSVFPTEELGEKLKIRGQLFFWRNVSGKKIRTECFSQFLQYFRDSSYPCNNVLRKDRIKHFKNFQNFFFFWNMLRIFWFIK